ncbi:LLM class flavin-dependent oxidoreductase [Pseudonocardia kunmingensis]|uniref:Alkanesulfonate monooxygenase SsuD/methylene tetrahydromethanopterin reductase-like flavin-dependent oxidoreductase (Luciferase family) n=1 Tax=Pseudonocardia kunmingensis TaxID=630975 RepID=A0A543CXF5_9PSEU|nr:LLM class flavin-dependent oxidoreductase [Pseudonocardia kunmingensis]TQM01784.1 alkanesulfonate monooxygenase SsuD/methylene tetrahydromethanopterin reductase-like flavin-dependent oxidoreductase (luciferase family) [Pseudonocardia kunmingensis]
MTYLPTVPRTTAGPLFADTGLKLGVFGLNVTSAGAVTASPERHEIDWDQNVRLVQLAEEAGFEAAIPFSRWRGFEGRTDPWGRSFDPYTWAAALAALTSRITLFATSHCLTVSPVMAAKQIATIDAISGGRVGLNVVAGWFAKELRMFGVEALDHEARYGYSEEWLQVVLRLWEGGEDFDFHGQWLTVENGVSRPGPVQRPHPPIMNAAFSARGHQLAARYADLSFVSALDAASAGRKVREIREVAAGFGREQSVWIAASVVCAETDREARALVERWSETDLDDVAVRNAIEWTMGGARMPQEQHRQLTKAVASTMAGYPLVGTPARIAEQLAELHAAGIDGVALTWMNYEAGIPRFIDEVLPILEREGVRRPVAAASAR